MRYLTWDGRCFDATWDVNSNSFLHTNVQAGAVGRSPLLNYLTWDRSQWQAERRTLNATDGFFHRSRAATSDKWDIWLAYLGCSGQPMRATFANGRLRAGVAFGVVDDVRSIDYRTWDDACWRAEWNPTDKVWIHEPPTGGQRRADAELHYITHDRSQWSATADGTQFYHAFHLPPQDERGASPTPNSGGTSPTELTDEICRSRPVPPGWVAVSYFHTLKCGHNPRNTQKIWRIAEKPVGTVIKVCNGVLPDGWVFETWGQPEACRKYPEVQGPSDAIIRRVR